MLREKDVFDTSEVEVAPIGVNGALCAFLNQGIKELSNVYFSSITRDRQLHLSPKNENTEGIPEPR